jgi:hypothetical protein
MRNSASKSRRKLQKIQEKIRRKAVTLLKKGIVNTTSTQETHAKF